MVKKSILDVIFMSEKRKNLLLLLGEGPHEMNTILKELKVSRQSLLPQIKILHENRLIYKKRDVYSLTRIGKLIVSEMVPLTNTLKVLEDNYEYWTTHDFSVIPEEMFTRLKELGHCDMVEPDLDDMFELNQLSVDRMLNSKYVLAVTAYLHPSHPSIFSRFLEQGKEVVIIMSEQSFKKLRADYHDEVEKFIKGELTNIYIYCDELKLASFVTTDNFMLLCLFNNEGRYDHRDLIFCSENAIHWGKDLFEHFKENSRLVTESWPE
ncbi:winged helix-turn-helix domain-containing protein [Methanolobus sp. ZRKC3]|uniref:helix-turn-helix transcriptional regulator n=1 Tax=Methanolobus sp. ZRKC3 TaxID=3125786 RepID=UPI00324B53A3